MTVTFFGHSDVSDFIRPYLTKLLIELIDKHNANNFYIGNNGNFDLITTQILRELQSNYNIKYTIVMASLKQQSNEYTAHTIYPEGLETIPQRYAICKRNEWMINRSDTVITYVTHNFGGAAKHKKLAKQKGKTIIELSDYI